MSRSLIARGVAVLGALTAALALGAPAASAAGPFRLTTTEPGPAAAGWLVQQFSNARHQRVPAGDHIDLSYDLGQGPVYYYDGGATIDAITALAATNTGGNKIRTATNYVAAHLDDYVDYGGANGGPYYGSIGKAAFLAIVTGRDPNNFGGHHLLTELKADECPSGSTTCTPGSNSNVFSSVATSYIVLAEARAGGAFAPSANLLTYLRALQCPDGGFTSQLPPSACVSDVDATGYAMVALLSARNRTGAVTRAATWLQAHRNANGSWTSQGAPNVDSTGIAAAALQAFRRDTRTSQGWLESQLVRTGPTVGAGARRGAVAYQGSYDATNSIKATSDAILGLVESGGGLNEVTSRYATPGTTPLTLAMPTLKHHRVKPRGSQSVTGTGFAANEQVRVRFHVRDQVVTVGTPRANSFGTVRFTFTIPRRFTRGIPAVRLVGLSSNLTSAAGFSIIAPHRTTSSSSPVSSTTSSSAPILADTGRDGRATDSQLLLGSGGVALGALLLLAGRRVHRGRHAR